MRPPNQYRKIVYGLIIVAIFGAMYPVHQLAQRRETATRTSARPRSARSTPGASCSSSPCSAGPRDRRERPLDPRRGAQAGAGLGPHGDDGRLDHQAPAPLPLGLDVPGLEPRLQRLGRVGRPRRQVRVDQEGHQVPPGGREEEREVARPDLGHRVDLLPQARLLRRVDHPPQALPRRRRRGVQVVHRPRDGSERRRGTTTSSSATAGSAARSRLVDDREAERARDVGRGEPRLRRSDPPAQGAARRPRVPLDARPRPDPLRRRASKRRAWSASPRPSAKSPRTNGIVRSGVGEVRRVRIRGVQRPENQMVRTRRLVQPRAVRQAHRDPAILDQPLGRPDELPLLERPLPGRDDQRGRPGPPALLRRHDRLQDGRLRDGRSRSSRKASTSGRPCSTTTRTIATTTSTRKTPGLVVKRYVRAHASARRARTERLPFKELLAAAETDTTRDPFDANEMLGPTGTSGKGAGSCPAAFRSAGGSSGSRARS